MVEPMIKFKLLNIILIVWIAALYAEPPLVVQSITPEYILLNGGKTYGLERGQTLKVYRSGQPVAMVKIEFISQQSAACAVIRQAREIEIGDQVEPCKECQTETTEQKKQSKTRVDGYLVLQQYQFDDQSSYNNDFQQPGVRFAFKVKNLWNKDYHINIKLRSRYQERKKRYNSTDNHSEWRNRLYQVSFGYDDPNAGFNYQVGRIISNTFSGVGYIDGVMVQHNTGKHLKTGIFAGTQPQWQYSDFQTDLQKYGSFVTYGKGDYHTQKLETTLAIAGEYHAKITSREFLYLQNSLVKNRKWSVYQRMELDINRGWRREKTGRSLSLSSLYLSGDYYFSDQVSGGLSYNNFRNYYTYELLSVADSLFDDAFRHGLRSNLKLRLSRDLRIYMNAGVRKNQDQNDYTYSWMTTLNYQNFIIKSARIQLRYSGFSNLYTRGINPFIKIGKSFRAGHSIYLGYGTYQYRYIKNDAFRKSQWVQFNTQVELPASLYLSGQYEYEWGDITLGNRIYFDLGYRF